MTASMPGETSRPQHVARRDATRNRAAILAAAREIFGSQGLDAPLSAVARRAGVGQGSLYRHFPDRTALATAVLEENVGEIERAGTASMVGLEDVLGVITWQLTRSTAFVELLRLHGDDGLGRSFSDRVGRVLARCRREDHRLSVDELMLAIAMVSGAVTGASPESREHRAMGAWRLLGIEVGPVRPGVE